MNEKLLLQTTETFCEFGKVEFKHGGSFPQKFLGGKKINLVKLYEKINTGWCNALFQAKYDLDLNPSCNWVTVRVIGLAPTHTIVFTVSANGKLRFWYNVTTESLQDFMDGFFYWIVRPCLE